MSEPPPLSRARPLWGRDLRHAALALLDRCGALSIRELLDALAADGFAIAEVARTTLWRIRRRWRNATDTPAVRRRPWQQAAVPRVTVDFGRLMPSNGDLDAIVSALMAELLPEPLLPGPP